MIRAQFFTIIVLFAPQPAHHALPITPHFHAVILQLNN